MAEVESEIERLAALCWRAHSELSWEWPTDATQPDHWRAGARAVIADRAAQPTTPLYVVFDGPPSHESGRFVELETEDGRSVGPAESGAEWREQGGLWYLGPLFPNPEPARQAERAEPPVTNGPTLVQFARERDAARTRAVAAERERDAMRREPDLYEERRLYDVLANWSAGKASGADVWRHVRDALLTAPATAPAPTPSDPLTPADCLADAEEMLRRIAASSLLGLDATEAAAICNELDRLRSAKGNP